MPEFEYTARAADGRVEHGSLVAKDARDLEEKLHQRDLILTSSAIGHAKSRANSFFARFQSVPAVQRMFFTQYLHVMLQAGFSVSRALETLAAQTTNKYFRSIIHELIGDVTAGTLLSKSLSKHPRVFSDLYVNMVAAGESSGKLDEVLERLASKMKKDHALLGKIKGALTYPIIILLAMIVVGVIMIVVVIPKISEIFVESNATLPLPTRVLLATSKFVVSNGIVVTIGIVVIAVVGARIFRTNKGQHALHTLFLRTPVLGPIVAKVSLARFSRSLSSLLETSIPIVDTFGIISRTMGNVLYREALNDAAVRLKTGNTIAKTLSEYPRLFPPLVTQMISIGEESGSLDSIAGELASFYEEEVDQTMANLSTTLEPVLMLLMGVGVAAMALAVILPIYSLTEHLG